MPPSEKWEAVLRDKTPINATTPQPRGLISRSQPNTEVNLMTILTYNNQNIEQRETDGYLNATQMCQANGKKVGNWLRNKETEAYIQGIASVTRIVATDLIVVNQGGSPSEQGTWIHPKLAICLGRWISVDFAIWCDEHIKTLMETGKTELVGQPQPQLPSRLIALETAKAVDEISSLLGEINPRLAQFLIDHAISDIMPSQPQLSGTRLRGVVEIAESLGFSVGMNNRSQLGRFVKCRCGALAMKEERLVNGTMRNVYCYPEGDPVVEQAIKDYFTH